MGLVKVDYEFQLEGWGSRIAGRWREREDLNKWIREAIFKARTGTITGEQGSGHGRTGSLAKAG